MHGRGVHGTRWRASGRGERENYENRLVSEEHVASASALCATFYHLAGGAEAWKARDMAERALELSPDEHRAQTLLGWIELFPAASDERTTARIPAATSTTNLDPDVLRRAQQKRAARFASGADAASRRFDAVLRAPGRETDDALMAARRRWRASARRRRRRTC